MLADLPPVLGHGADSRLQVELPNQRHASRGAAETVDLAVLARRLRVRLQWSFLPQPPKPMRHPTHVVLLAMSLVIAAASPAFAQDFGRQPDAATQREILAIREQAWRTWFANDTVAFKRIVPELVALGWDGGAWEDRAMTMAAMGEFAKTGMTLASLEFPRNVFQQYGDVVILYTSFTLVLKTPAGQTEQTTGRGTEIFVRRDGRWVHTGWHLDRVGT